MTRRLLVVVLVLVAVVAAVFMLTRSQPAPPKPETKAEAPVPPPPPKEVPKAEAPAVVETPKRSARREPAPKPADVPKPPPAPVEAASETATLHIDSDVPGAQVFIDRVYIGTAPATAKDVKPGTHRLNVAAQGYDGAAETIEVVPGPRDILIKFKEVKLDAAIDVVHKHRMGSCQGRLVATPKGIRYETSNKDDGFAADLTALETFEVDYIAKILKVKPKNGRRYEFTDPGGNADHLFVFHRDVDKARQRLLKGDQ